MKFTFILFIVLGVSGVVLSVEASDMNMPAKIGTMCFLAVAFISLCDSILDVK